MSNVAVWVGAARSCLLVNKTFSRSIFSFDFIYNLLLNIFFLKKNEKKPLLARNLCNEDIDLSEEIFTIYK